MSVRWRGAAVLALLLCAAALGAVLLWRPARLDAPDEHLYRRTLAEVAQAEHESAVTLSAALTPSVRHESREDCVELRGAWPRRRLHARACYDRRTGEERRIDIYTSGF